MKYIKLEQQDKVLYVELCRPEKRNAFNPDFIKEIRETFETKISKDTVCLVLKAEGKSFSAGADLDYMKSMVDFSFEDNIKDAENLFDMFYAVYTCPCPTLAKVKGSVMGGGLGLIASCDIVACDESSVLSFSEVKLGLVASVIFPFVFRKLKSSHARKWMFTAERFSAKEAFDSELVHFVANNKESLDNYIEKQVKNFKAVSLDAVRETKKLLLDFESIDSCFKQRCVKLIAERRMSEEAQKLIGAFLKR